MMASAWLVALLGAVSVLLVIVASRLEGLPIGASTALATLVALLATALPDARVAFSVIALSGAIHAFRAGAVSRDAAFTLAASALAVGVAAAALVAGRIDVAFVASTVGIVLRAGVWPLHSGVAALCERDPAEQTRQLATLLPLVFVHLRFVDHHEIAATVAPFVVWAGAVSALIGALMALGARDVRGLLRTSTVMHGGMVLASIGAAGGGHYAAALFAALTMAIALGGFAGLVVALEARAGRVTFDEQGGRIRELPALATAFVVFGLAGVAAPGTAGFIADDLLLHGLSEYGLGAAALMILASALLAIATMTAFSRVFLGRPRRVVATDLGLGDRVALGALAALLFVLGVVPSVLIRPAAEVLGAAPPTVSSGTPPGRSFAAP